MPRSRTFRGFSLVEVLFAVTLFVVAVAGLFGLYSASLTTMLAADNNSASSADLLRRLDQIRRSGWANATSPTSLSTLLLSSSNQNLGNIVTERVTLSAVVPPQASPAPSPAATASATPAPFTVIRTGTTVTVSPSSPASMISQSAVNVTVGVIWSDNANRQHTRELSTVISKGALTY